MHEWKVEAKLLLQGVGHPYRGVGGRERSSGHHPSDLLPLAMTNLSTPIYLSYLPVGSRSTADVNP